MSSRLTVEGVLPACFFTRKIDVERAVENYTTECGTFSAHLDESFHFFVAAMLTATLKQAERIVMLYRILVRCSLPKLGFLLKANMA